MEFGRTLTELGATLIELGWTLTICLTIPILVILIIAIIVMKKGEGK